MVSRVFLTIDRSVYGVRPLGCGASRAFRLNKPDGILYDVRESRFGPRCDCPDFIFRRDGLDPEGCKHVKALVDAGLIDRVVSPRVRPRAATAS